MNKDRREKSEKEKQLLERVRKLDEEKLERETKRCIEIKERGMKLKGKEDVNK